MERLIANSWQTWAAIVERGLIMAVLTIEKKQGKKYIVTYQAEDNSAYLYRRLSNDLIAKQINKCTYITRIRRQPLYNGCSNIIVTYDNGVRATYTIED